MNPHIDAFLKLMPYSKVIASDDELRYRFRQENTARWFERRAQEIILENKLALAAAVETWKAAGYAFEISLVVKLVPEEYNVLQVAK